MERGSNGEINRILVTESKFALNGGLPRLARDRGEIQQLSNAWLNKQHNLLSKHHPETWQIIDQNKDKIRFKANVLDENRVNKWYHYGRFDSGSKAFDAVRISKLWKYQARDLPKDS